MSPHSTVICKHEGKKFFWETGIHIHERTIIKRKLVRQYKGVEWIRLALNNIRV